MLPKEKNEIKSPLVIQVPRKDTLPKDFKGTVGTVSKKVQWKILTPSSKEGHHTTKEKKK